MAEARAKNPDTMAWLYIPGAEVDDPVMQAEDNGYYLKLDENGEYAMWGCYYAHCENEIGGRDKLDKTPPFSATPPATATRTVCGSPSYTAIWTQTSQRSIRISISLWMART